MPPILERSLKIIIAILLLAWLLTLGIYHTREMRAQFTIPGGDAREMFAHGALRIYPNTQVGATDRTSSGIPFLFHSKVDAVPYTIYIRFTAAQTDPAQTLSIDEVSIKYADGETAMAPYFGDGLSTSFELNDGGGEPSATITREASFIMPQAISKPQNCTLKLRGHLQTPAGKEPYQQTIHLQFTFQSHWQIGWKKLGWF